MMIKLGERIKALRLRDGRTQDILANALGVTAQAVSRWEKEICYPDMEIIPSIANYFGVSIDELFGYDNEREQKVEALGNKIREMNLQNNGIDVNMDECISLAREALIEFPGNERITFELACALFNAGYVRHGEHHISAEDGFTVYDVVRHQKYSEWQEAIKLYEKLLLSLTDGKMRERAVIQLSQLYKNTGAHEKALQLAKSAPSIQASNLFLQINAVDGKEAVASCSKAVLETIMHSAELMVQIVLTDGSLAPEMAADILQNAAGLFDLICTDQDYDRYNELLACIHMLRSYYLWLANQKDEAFGALSKAIEHANHLDALNGQNEENFTSPVLQHLKCHNEISVEDGHFSNELPELWPWWDVPKRDLVKAEMQADPRWKECLGRI